MTIPEEMSTESALSPQSPGDGGSTPAAFKIDPSAQPQEEAAEQSQPAEAAHPPLGTSFLSYFAEDTVSTNEDAGNSFAQK